jgi:hypothetical protein
MAKDRGQQGRGESSIGQMANIQGKVIGLPIESLNVDKIAADVKALLDHNAEVEKQMIADGRAKPRRPGPFQNPYQELTTLRDDWEQLCIRREHHSKRIAESNEVIERLNQRKAAATNIIEKFTSHAKTNGMARDLVAEAENVLTLADAAIEKETKLLRANTNILNDTEKKIHAFPVERYKTLIDQEKLEDALRRGIKL